MNIQRQYITPNCTLVLEGLSNETGASLLDGQGIMSILVNAQCNFIGSNKPLSGGRDFFESLVKAVSAYSQECLSGLRHPVGSLKESSMVHLEAIAEKNVHRLTLEPPPDTSEERVEIDLTTVQLFDLVEAVDQFFADRSTLPDLSLELQPVSKRYRKVDEPLPQRVAPVALGISSLAIAASALFFVPIPEVRKPEPASDGLPTETIPSTTESPPTESSPRSESEEEQ